MRDLWMGESDIFLENGDLRIATGLDALVQRVRSRLLLWRGEYFLDNRAGVPWLHEVLGSRSPRGEVVRGAIRQPILDDDEVLGIESFDLDYESESRKLRVSIELKTVYGNHSIIGLEV